MEKAEEKETPIFLIIILALCAFSAIAGLLYSYNYDLKEKYSEGYIDGQKSITVKYSLHGTVIPLDVQHSVLIDATHPYDCKLYQNDSDYGCKWLTDTLKVEVLTPIAEPKK